MIPRDRSRLGLGVRSGRRRVAALSEREVLQFLESLLLLFPSLSRAPPPPFLPSLPLPLLSPLSF